MDQSRITHSTLIPRAPLGCDIIGSPKGAEPWWDDRDSGGNAMNGKLIGTFAAAWAIVVAGGATAHTADMTVIASGLDGPRGLKFGPDGNLYVAEAGTGGTESTVGSCTQVPSPVGPYTGGKTARISMIRPD